MVQKDIYNVGDIVKLKSGGPDMTVNEQIFKLGKPHEFTGNYRCQWFAGKKLDQAVFPHDSLIKVIPEDKAK